MLKWAPCAISILCHSHAFEKHLPELGFSNGNVVKNPLTFNRKIVCWLTLHLVFHVITFISLGKRTAQDVHSKHTLY